MVPLLTFSNETNAIFKGPPTTSVLCVPLLLLLAGQPNQPVRLRNTCERETSLLDVMVNSADTDCEERPVNCYGSPLARRSSGNVGVQAIGAIFCITENGADSLHARKDLWLSVAL